MRQLLVALIMVLAAGLAMASGSEEASSTEEGELSGTLTLYTSETLTDVQEYVNQFEKLNPGVEVEVFRTGTTELTARLQTELQAGSTPADVVWFADMALFEDFNNDGVLAQIDPPAASNVPDQFVYFDGAAYEVRLIYQVIAYNTNMVDDEVTGWSDLVDSQYEGRVGSASPFYSGATLTQVASVSQDERLGWDYYRELAENDPVVGGGNGGVAQNIATGEFAIGLTIDFMARSQKEQGAPVDYVYQEEGALYVPTPIGVMESSDDKELGEAFINYLMTVPGQLQLQANGYMPVSSEVALPEGVPSPADISVLETDWQYLRNNRQELLDTYGEIFNVN